MMVRISLSLFQLNELPCLIWKNWVKLTIYCPYWKTVRRSFTEETSHICGTQHFVSMFTWSRHWIPSRSSLIQPTFLQPFCFRSTSIPSKSVLWYLMFFRHWLWRFQSPGIHRSVVRWESTDFSERHVASIFSKKPAWSRQKTQLC
jgi:hypothetical protein